MKGKEPSVSPVNPGRREVAETLLLCTTRRTPQVTGLASSPPRRFDMDAIRLFVATSRSQRPGDSHAPRRLSAVLPDVT